MVSELDIVVLKPVTFEKAPAERETYPELEDILAFRPYVFGISMALPVKCVPTLTCTTGAFRLLLFHTDFKQTAKDGKFGILVWPPTVKTRFRHIDAADADYDRMCRCCQRQCLQLRSTAFAVIW